MPRRGREIQLAMRPQGMPTPACFRIAETDVPDPAEGEILVRNSWMSVDPYMRGRMNDGASFVEPFALDAPLDGGAVGVVIASRAASVPVGATVAHELGWRELAVLPADAARVVDIDVAPAQAHLGVLGMTGFTAYVGLLDIAALRADDVVFVSAAAGAVGSLVGQIAKLRGHRVIGSAGSPAKVAYLLEQLGFDAAFDYHHGPAAELLGAVAPDGIDVYFDNVAGEQLEAALGALRLGGRVALCGAMTEYNAAAPPPGPRNLYQAVRQRLTLRGFIVGDHEDRRPAFEADVARWLREGAIEVRETVFDGLEHAPEALIGQLQGRNLGKMLIRLDGEES